MTDQIAKSYAVLRKIKRHANDRGLTISQVCQLYGLPKGVAKGPQQIIAIVELGGGYNLAAVNSALRAEGLPLCRVTDVGIRGAANSYTGDPNSADVEVMLDLYIAAGVYGYMTGQPASIRMIFAPNTGDGFIEGVRAATGCSSLGISWGSPESPSMDNYTRQMDMAFDSLSKGGTTSCCASGDNGSSDGTPRNVLDYPGSSPFVVNCGGTSIVTNGVSITNESVWNHDGGAAGGGFSRIEAVPSWQQGFVPAGSSGRGGPDLCAMADPNPGYKVPVFGATGGTSAVAPLMAGFFAAVNCARSTAGLLPLGLCNWLLYVNEPAFYDVVNGNNFGYSATKGWDAASGLGSLRGLLFTALGGTVAPPPPPPPPPPPSDSHAPYKLYEGATQVGAVSGYSDLRGAGNVAISIAARDHVAVMIKDNDGDMVETVGVPPWPTPPPTPTLQKQIDAIFAILEKRYASSPLALRTLKTAQKIIDQYLAANGATDAPATAENLPLLQEIVRIVFISMEKQYPLVAPWLSFIEKLVQEAIANPAL